MTWKGYYRQLDTPKVCWYCDGGDEFEMEHAPTPRRSGGVAMVWSCISCHRLKDMIQLGDWSPNDAVLAVRELTELGMVDALLLTPGPVRTWPAEWPTMTRMARVFWAKSAALRSDLTTLNPTLKRIESELREHVATELVARLTRVMV